MNVARLKVLDNQIEATVPYALKAIPKSFSRKWDPKKKVWLVPLVFVDQLADALRAAGATVYVQMPDGTPWTGSSSDSTHGVRATPATDWADALFAAVGPDRQAAVHRALAKTLHPDLVNGNTELMQQLNDARDRAARSGGPRR